MIFFIFAFMKPLFTILLLSLSVAVAQAQIVEPVQVIDTLSEMESDSLFVVDTLEDIEDSEVTKMFESLLSLPYFGNEYLQIDTVEMNIYGYDYSEIPVFPDSVYRQRIEQLARQTTLPLAYNAHVKKFIELYAVKRRGLTGRMLGLSHVYFPLFEEKLDKYNMPLELKYLAMIESALNPTAGSKMGAKGLWQFMYGTGKLYGLKSTTLVEERYDPQKATEAACRCMLDLYNRYKDWFLVLAAYNAGPGNVNKAIKRAGGAMNYWAIWPYLPRETQSYVPSFIAVAYVVNYAAEHNLYPLDPGLLMSGTDTVWVRDVLSFQQLVETIGVPIEDLRTFNPQYVKEIIPATDTIPYVLRMPTQYALEFIGREKEIYAYQTQEALDKAKILEQAQKVAVETAKTKYHTVKSGETLSMIAKKYNTTVAKIKKLNNLKSDKIKAKQKLRVQ